MTEKRSDRDTLNKKKNKSLTRREEGLFKNPQTNKQDKKMGDQTNYKKKSSHKTSHEKKNRQV